MRFRFLVVASVAVLASVQGCDRTRPYPGTTAGNTPPGVLPPPVVATGAPVGGPVQTQAGWKFTLTAPQAQSVHLVGSFNEWSASADPMTKGASGTWEIVKALPAGSHQYKFLVDGSQWKEDPANPQGADDGYGGKNSVVDVGGTSAPVGGPPVTPPASHLARGPQKAAEGWKFVYDAADARTVHLAGSFNEWSASADPLTKSAEGAWEIVKALPAGTHQYKFLVNGVQWKPDPGNPQATDDGFGGTNSVLVVP